MDVQRGNAGDSRTIVLLHGKNFSGSPLQLHDHLKVARVAVTASMEGDGRISVATEQKHKTRPPPGTREITGISALGKLVGCGRTRTCDDHIVRSTW